MAATYKQNFNIFDFIARNNPDIVASAIAALGYDVTSDDVAATAEKQAATANRVKARKPSADTIRNRTICADILAEFNARNGEFTAADIAGFIVDPDGMPMSTRKVAALLAGMVKRGELEKSPEKWAVSHYALPGYEFAAKPTRRSKSNKSDTVSDN